MSELQNKVRKENYALFHLKASKSNLSRHCSGVVDTLHLDAITYYIECAIKTVKIRQANRKPRKNPMTDADEKVIP